MVAAPRSVERAPAQVPLPHRPGYLSFPSGNRCRTCGAPFRTARLRRRHERRQHEVRGLRAAAHHLRGSRGVRSERGGGP